ncbi:hypothetical protein F4779DRAFT_482854 [Xylariaceae sp. FL0662B]|nr:hypothetical protein F4779DRAFT_482854 [Xylariaceae sp. FL0662B]
MVEVLWSSTPGQTFSGSGDMMEMAGRFISATPNPTQETSRTASPQLGSPKEPSAKNGAQRAPRRAFTTTDHQPLGTPKSLALQRRLATPSATPRESPETDSYFQIPTQNPQVLSPSFVNRHPSPAAPLPAGSHATSQRPILPGPLRSYSVMDYEPIPFTHQPGTAITLSDLPPELHFAIFDFLDPIDSTCLGLTSKHFYAIHRRIHGKVPLSARREGPNDMEWVWRNAGPWVPSGANKQNSLAMLSPRGQVYCRKCRTARCELHNHIKEWAGDKIEYCEVTQKFGSAASKNAKAFCYRSSPRHPHRCGRHTRQQRTVRLV